MRYLFILAAILCSFLAINGKAQNKNNKEINNYIAEIQKQYNIPGLALAVIKNGEVIHKKNYGFANIELAVPVNDKTLFPLFSTSKVISVIAIYQLIEQKKLSLDNYISDFLNDLPDSWKKVQIKTAILSLLLFPIFYFLIFRPLIRNIEERKLIEDDLRIAAVAFEIKDPTLITDVSGNIIRANKKFLAKLGYRMEEIVGQNPRIFKSGMHDQKFYEQLWKELLRTGCWSGEIRSKTKEGRILHPFWLTITAIKNEQQETTHYIGIYNF